MIFKHGVIGVDLGDGSLKVVQMKGGNVSIAAYIDMIRQIRDSESALIGLMKDFFKSIGIVGKKAVIHLPGSLAFIRTAHFPQMTLKELGDAVIWEARRQMPYHAEDAVIDYIAEETDDGIEVTYAAGDKKAIMKYLFPFKEAGLNVRAVDVSPLCLARSLKPQNGSSNVIILDIGAASTEMNIYKGGFLRMTRSMEMGGDFIVESLVGSGVVGDEALRLLKTGGVTDLRTPLSELMREVSRSLDFFEATFKDKSFSKVLLSGGVSLNPSVADFFSEAFGLSVDVPNPFEGASLEDETIRRLGPRFAVAVGLAKRGS